MGSCRNHPDRDAQTVCSSCGAELCEECVAPGEGEPLCFGCSIVAAEQDVAKEWAVEKPKVAPQPPSRRFSIVTRAILIVGTVIIAAELAIILFMRPDRAQYSPASGRHLDRVATAATGADVILIAEGLEEHRRETGEYPQDLFAIAESLPPELVERLADPSTVYELDGKGGYRIRFRGVGPYEVSVDTEVRSPMVKGVEP